jgi:hypothetical protein
MTNQQINTQNYGFNQNNQGPTQVDPNQTQAINQGLSAGFGNFFFNMNDPNVAKTNIPIKQGSSMHVSVIVTTLLLFAGIGIGIGGMGTLF